MRRGGARDDVFDEFFRGPAAMKGVAALAASVEGLARPGFFARVRTPRAPAAELPAAPPPSPPPEATDLEPTIYRFIFKHSMPQQIYLLVLTLASFPALYFSLDLPKTIVNHAIRESAKFPQAVFGFEFERVPYLILLCVAFLLLVLVNGIFKFYINTYKGRLGERMLRRFRYLLYQRLLRFPLTYFHKTSSAQIIPMITAESESLGGFIGDAVALPAFQGGTLLTIVLFMFIQDPVLGAAAVSLYPIQAYIIPKLQRKTNQLGKQRVRTVRVVADRVQESAAGIVEIHVNDTVKLQLTDFANVLGRIFDIRFEIYQRKFFTKFLNNFINQLTPFFFYLIGGYLVIRGSLSFGALVAVLAAYKDMASPWKELLDFYQNKENTRITYEQIIEQFDPAGMTDEQLLLAEPDSVPRLEGELAVSNLSLAEDDRSRVVDAVSFSLKLDEHVAVIGQSGGGKNELALLLARLARPTSGRIAIGGHNLADLPVAVVGRRIGYVSATPYLFTGSLRDNLLLSLRHRPLAAAEYDEAETRRQARRVDEARRSGNIDLDLHADWIDLASAGVANHAELSAAHRRDPGAARLRGGCLQFRAARPHRPGRPPRTDRATARGAPCAGRAARRRRHHQAGRDLRCRALQQQRDGRRKPAVRHADRPGLRVRRARRQCLRAAGSRQGRSDRRTDRGWPAGRRDDDRDVRRAAARARILRAVQLYRRR